MTPEVRKKLRAALREDISNPNHKHILVLHLTEEQNDWVEKKKSLLKGGKGGRRSKGHLVRGLIISQMVWESEKGKGLNEKN